MDVEVHPDEEIFGKYVSVLTRENLPSNEDEYKEKVSSITVAYAFYG